MIDYCNGFMVPCRVQSVGRDSGQGDRDYLGGFPEQLILHELDLLGQQMRSIKMILEEVRPMERIQELEHELGSYRRLETQIRNTLVDLLRSS